VLRHRDLVLCSGAVGDASFAEFLAAARGAGYRGVTFVMDMYVRALEETGGSAQRILDALAEHELAADYVDGFLTWLPGAPRAGVFDALAGFSEADFFDAAEAVGADLVNVVEVFGLDVGVDGAAEALAGVADRALERGLRISLEMTPLGSVPDLATAWEIVRRAGRANLGLLLDTWHYARGASTEAQLLAVPPDRYFGLQISDASGVAWPDLLEETMRGRLLPGEGVAALPQLLGRLERHGVRLPYGLEVLADELSALPPAEAAGRAAASLRSVLAAARP
jgi:sugar phosphate isomerase/epimerase